MSIHHINNVCKYFTIWNLLFEVMEWKNGAIYTTFSPLYSKKINGNDGKVTQGVSWSLLIYIYIYIYHLLSFLIHILSSHKIFMS